MQNPGRLPLYGDRWTPFTRVLQFEGIDLTGAAFAMQVRDRKDGGLVRADLTTVASASSQGVRLIYAGTDTVEGHLTAARIDEAPEGLSPTDPLTLSLVGIRINEATMEAMTQAPEIGTDATAYWDLHITQPGALKDVFLFGPFVIRAGVTE